MKEKNEIKNNEISNNKLKGNINVSVIRERVINTDPELVEKSEIDEKGLDELIRKIEEKQRSLGVPQDRLEERIFRRVFAVLRKPFVKPIDPEEVKEYQDHEKSLKESDFEPQIPQYGEDEKPDYSGDAFEWGQKDYLKTNLKPAKFFVNDHENNRCFETTIQHDKEKDYDFESRQVLYGYLDFLEVIEYEPILPGIPRKFQFSCRTNCERKCYTGTFNEITGQIDSDGLIYNENKIKEVLKEAKNLLQEKGDYKLSKLPPNPGFFWIDGKLVSNHEYHECNKSRLTSSLEFLDDFVGYYKGNEFKLGYILSWMIISPFVFAMKQVKNDDIPGSLYLLGKANSGKSTVASLILDIWKLPRTDSFLSTGQIDSVARMGNAISKMTYPVVFDEGDLIFNEKEDVVSLFKSSIYGLIARAVLDSNRNETKIPALSSIIFTSNKAAPKDASLGRRMHIFEFSIDHPRTKEEKDKFNELFGPEKFNGPLKKLSAIGDYVANEMLKNPKNIHKPWLNVAKDIWTKMYQDAELEIPKWLKNPETPTGLEESWEAEEEKLFMIVKKLILQNDKSGLYETHDENNLRTQRTKAEEVIYGSKVPWIQYYTPTKGKDAGKKFTTIDSGILLDIKKEYGLNYELKRIAEDLNGNYGSKFINGRNRKVAYWELEEFLKMFDPM